MFFLTLRVSPDLPLQGVITSPDAEATSATLHFQTDGQSDHRRILIDNNGQFELPQEDLVLPEAMLLLATQAIDAEGATASVEFTQGGQPVDIIEPAGAEFPLQVPFGDMPIQVVWEFVGGAN